jgi:MbtH protein
MFNDDIPTTYVVLLNHEEQYSLWPKHKLVPAGWRLAGKEGSKEECSAFVDEVWTDMRPLSLRRQMDAQGEEPGGQP